MLFGLCNAPVTFQRVMQRVLAGLEWKTCFVYLDDVLIASKTFEDQLVNLHEVFYRLREANLQLKPKKCGLLKEQVPFLGHVVLADGIQADPAKMEWIKSYPKPTDTMEVHRFVGLASYYRWFIARFAAIAAPLHSLLKKDTVFVWSRETECAFDHLKTALTTAPVLAYPRFGPGYTFVLETDASTVGLGAILSQVQDDGMIHPIAYASRSVNKHEQYYGISELETVVQLQKADLDLCRLLEYLESGTLPDNEQVARKLILESCQFDVIDGVLYHQDSLTPARLCLVVPTRTMSNVTGRGP